jgi:hypothetical protein
VIERKPSPAPFGASVLSPILSDVVGGRRGFPGHVPLRQPSRQVIAALWDVASTAVHTPALQAVTPPEVVEARHDRVDVCLYDQMPTVRSAGESCSYRTA